VPDYLVESAIAGVVLVLCVFLFGWANFLRLALFATAAWMGCSIGLTGTGRLGAIAVDASGPTRLAFGILGLGAIAAVAATLRGIWQWRVLGHGIAPDGVLRDRSGRPVR